MKIYFLKFLKNPTLFSLFGVALIVVGIPIMLYTATLDGGSSLGAFMIVGWLVLIAVVILIDRVLLKLFSHQSYLLLNLL